MSFVQGFIRGMTIMEMNKTLTPENEKNAFYLLEQVAGFSYQASLRAVAVLGIADNLLDGQKQQRNWQIK